MEAQIITDRQRWNDFVVSAAACNIKQSYEWGEFSAFLGADEALHIGVVDEHGQLCAAMLMTITRAPVLKQNYFYVPRGPIIADPTSPVMTVLLNYVKAEARKRRAFMLKVEPNQASDDQCWLGELKRRGFHTNPHHMHIRSEWVLDISPDEKTILSGMKEKWRYNIRLAARKGITVRRAAGQADIDTWYRLYQTTSERDKFFINQQSFYEDVLQRYGEQGHAALLLAEYEGQAIAGTIVLVFGPWSYYMYGASSNEHREKMPNHLLQWTGIQWAKSQGARYYNFGGIPEILEQGEELYGVYLFKRGFGGYAVHSMATHDLVYQPVVYQAYRTMLDVKHRLDKRREKRLVTQAVHSSPA